MGFFPVVLRKFFFKVHHFFHKQSRHLSGKLTIALALCAIVSCIATYLLLIKAGNSAQRMHRVVPFIYLDLFLLLALTGVIARRLYQLWRDHTQGLAGSKLHVKLVVLFSAVAVTPAILVAIFSVLFFNVGVNAWFSEPVREALREAENVAEAYVRENQNAIRHDAAMIVGELRSQVPMLIHKPDEFSEILTNEVEHRGIGEAIVFDAQQKIIARSYLTFALEFEKILIDAFKKAQQGELVILRSENDDRVRALVRLDPVTNTYLYLGKFVDPEVLKHLNKTEAAVLQYSQLESQRSDLHITFIAFFALIALILLLAAIWVGLSIASFIVQPVQKLITAADAVRQGNLSVSVEDISDTTELGHLAEAFNRMIAQLYGQRQELVIKNKTLEQRQQFIESVLSGVSAGIIGVSEKRQVDLINERALDLLNITQDATRHPLKEISPELASLLDKVNDFTPHLEQIAIERGRSICILQVCIVPEVNLGAHNETKPQRYVITFDDITTLVSAQRKAAWSDVARKIAHEIKNPLTPIQLSAERLKRRYLKEVQSDPNTFQECIDTIIRQVGHIGKLVSEFSSFARMPEPDLKQENLVELCRQAVFLQKQAHSNVIFEVSLPADPVFFTCDAQQIAQVLTNLLQNALDAMENQEAQSLSLNLALSQDEITITINDTGPGFPSQHRERLTEPYFTTRTKGTGLGLAIVAKIVEDHGGVLELTNNPGGGASVIMHFRKQHMDNKNNKDRYTHGI